MPVVRLKECDNRMYVGVDPGGSGGIAAVLGSGKVVLLEKMPDTEADLWQLMDTVLGGMARNQHGCAGAMVEQVGGFVKGSGGNIGSAMFKFGQSYGSCRMALTAAGLPWEPCPPQRWQAGLKIPKGKAKGPELKRVLRQHAQNLFPGVKVTAQTADALLIAEWCRRSRLGIGQGTGPTPK